MEIAESFLPTSSRERKAVFGGILLAWFLSSGFYYGAWVFLGKLEITSSWERAQAGAFAAILASISLIVGIGWAAQTRHFKSNIDGSMPKSGSSLDLTLRFVRNTQEQLILFFVACVAALVFIPQNATILLPIAGVWFLLARAMFAVGYALHPLARSVGFAGTFHPTIAIIFYALMGWIK